MDLDEAMRTTFAARQYTGDPLPDALLYRILDAARFAPSGGNRQGTRVILIRDRDTRAEIARLAEPAAKRYLAQPPRCPGGCSPPTPKRRSCWCSSSISTPWRQWTRNSIGSA
jgi:nitroreductase